MNIPQPALGERTTLHLEIPFEQAGLLRQILKMGFLEASKCSDPTLFGGTGALQRAIADLHESVDRQLRQIEGGTR